MPTRRQERVNRQLVEVVAEALRDLRDERIGFVTITEAEVTPDMRQAKIYCSVFGDDADRHASMAAIHRNHRDLQHAVGRSLRMKNTPRLYFVLDERVARSDEIQQLIRAARATDGHLDAHGEESADDSPDAAEPGEAADTTKASGVSGSSSAAGVSGVSDATDPGSGDTPADTGEAPADAE